MVSIAGKMRGWEKFSILQEERSDIDVFDAMYFLKVNEIKKLLLCSVDRINNGSSK